MRLRPPRSLIGQFALLHIATALLAVAALPVGVSVLLHRVAGHYQREVLRQQAGQIEALLKDRDPGIAIDTADMLAGGLTLTIVDAARHVVAERGPPRPALIARVPLDTRPRAARWHRFAAISRPVGAQWIVVSQDDAAPEVVTDDIVRTFLRRFLLLVLPLMLVVPLVGIWLSRRLTLRMRAVSTIAAAIGPRTLDRRLPHRSLPLEIEPLASATNAALDRLEQAFTAQAAFAADIAHELRTPLAVIRLRADGIAEPVLRDTMLAAVDRAARVIEQLMGLADLERPMEESCALVDLSALAEQVVADRAPMMLRGGHDIALLDQRPAPLHGYAGAIALALENLIDNAARHTPAGTAITVVAGPGPRLTVCDDGPPLDPAQIARMTQRFWRAGTGGDGSGLGLSIVARVAAAHGGTLRLAAGEGGRGLAATLMLAPPGPDQNSSVVE
ncbi:sensor histidine kinase [Sphingomonas endophytica]|uniref:histidine kinase n=1 Tax=Sphingomonas endophytica TaxID=869719 RepID=A0A147HWW8_9SPHN|nr:HAMP domain-containing sensor histidine kinase [Sphingomonas endophytica]KTT69396.1 hypothetical protein NS334_14650 [Sphingomonas endophytica]